MSLSWVHSFTLDTAPQPDHWTVSELEDPFGRSWAALSGWSEPIGPWAGQPCGPAVPVSLWEAQGSDPPS